jgi:hypothetical protein
MVLANADADGPAAFIDPVRSADFEPWRLLRKFVSRCDFDYVLPVEERDAEPPDKVVPNPNILFIDNAQEIRMGVLHVVIELSHQNLSEAGVNGSFVVGHDCGRGLGRNWYVLMLGGIQMANKKVSPPGT